MKAIKSGLFIFFTSLTLASLSQVDTTSPIEEDSYSPVFPNTICLDNHSPFFNIPEQSSDFELNIFNRWGELLVQTNDSNFILERLLSQEQMRRFRYMDQLVYVVKFKSSTGKEYRFQGHLTYIEYCNCG